MTGTDPEKIADARCQIGENPLWHADEKRLYWVDIPAGRLLRFDPAGGGFDIACESTDAIGGFTIQRDGSILLFGARGAVTLLKDGKMTAVIEELPQERDSRFNDVIADPEGRVFCGTMSSESHPGRLYRLDTDGSVEVMAEGIGTSNGMGFSPQLDVFYHTDTRAQTIYICDYRRESGDISGRRPFLRPDGPGRPDGMTIDRDGFVWSAFWDGGRVARYTPEGTEDMRIELPARKVTSVTFGGNDYCDMYITTAGGERRNTEGEGAGALFRVRPGVCGAPEFRSNVTL